MLEWNAHKAATNLRKHDVSFEEAATVFADPDAMDGPDLKHSRGESDLGKARIRVAEEWWRRYRPPHRTESGRNPNARPG